MKNPLRQIYAPTLAVVWNLFLAFIVYQIARAVYYFENASYFRYTFDVFRGGLLFDTSAILYTNVVYVSLMLLPWHRKENPRYQRICRGLFVAVNALAFAANLADSVYFQYTMRRTTTTVFSEFSHEGNLLGIIGTEIVRHWYLGAAVLLMAGILWLLTAVPKLSASDIVQPKKYNAVCLASLVLFIPFCIAGMRGGFVRAVRPITVSNANQYASRPLDAALVLNTPFSLLRTIGKNVFRPPRYFETKEELEAIYTPVHRAAEAEAQNQHIKTKKNVVILIVESFGREYIGAFNRNLEDGEYRGYTPFADALIAKSTVFKYSFCNGRKSIDGMPSILSSIPMFIEPFILTPASMNDMTGIAGILGKEGYQTAFFHGAQNGSMGFEAFARKTGFQHYFGRTEYEAAHGTDDFDGTWAIWDEPFLQFYAEEMSKMKQPFMTAVFTASSHHPFAIPDKYKEQFPEEHLKIHKCIRYTDMALGKFFETASKQPWFDNTIFVLTSDHTNMSDHEEYKTDLGGFYSPIVIYDPSHPVGEMQDKIAQQIDILPTLLGLLGYGGSYFGFGIDILNTPGEKTWAVSYLNGIYQYVRQFDDRAYLLQFDGTEAKALYDLNDRLLEDNLLGEVSDIEQETMERELKAIIQQYMERMTQNRLLP